ncbi:MAG TPA: immunoglobulin domain-containing protein [Solirubrobacteraceae bacterium]|nr:immunoglobulin domain-containing protein [Solirubrobacteraceae bacterium]
MARSARARSAKLILVASAALMLAAGPAGARELASGREETPKAPRITTNPPNQTVEAGTQATFVSAATGSPTPTAQWERSTNNGSSWNTIAGATSPDYIIASAETSQSGYEYRVTYTNASGTATSKAATLKVYAKPHVTVQPSEQVVLVGHNATFEAEATGFPTPTVQWEQSGDDGASWTNVGGATSRTLTISDVALSQSGKLYRAAFKNEGGEAISAAAQLVVEQAPAVTTQPASSAVEAGGSTSFTVAGSGTPTPTVQWQLSTDGGSEWSNIAGATEATLAVVSATTEENGYEYRATLTNAAGSATSNAATLSVYLLPQVTEDPTSTTVEEGHTATFSAAASGFPAPTVQWEVSTNGGGKYAAVGGATSPTLTLADPKLAENGYEYRARFTNVGGSVVTTGATLTVDTLPAITKQPSSTTAIQGQGAKFESAANGFPTPTVQWQLSTDSGAEWSNIEGATSASLSLASVSYSLNGDEYRAAYANSAGTTYTNAATLTVTVPPEVTSQPEWQTALAGEPVSFTATATGHPAPTVQWERSTNGGTSFSPIAGATSTTYSIAAVHAAENGYRFRAVFTDSAGTATSEYARLTITTSRYQAVAWGQNESRQLGSGTDVPSSDTPVTVSKLNFVKAIAAGTRNGMALLEDGTVRDWGSNEDGQLGDGSDEEGTSSVPVKVSGLSEVTSIAAGENHCLALLANGTVKAWGDGEQGQLGDGSTGSSDVPVTVSSLKGVVAIAAAANYSMALLENGTVEAWGENELGQLGDGGTARADIPQPVKNLSGVTAIAAGGEFAMALLSSHKVDIWGSDQYDEIADEGEHSEFVDKPVEVAGLSSVNQIAAGATHALALTSGGTVYGWGQDSEGELGNGTFKATVTKPTAITGLGEVAYLSAGDQYSLALQKDGHLLAWGTNTYGTLGDGSSGAPSASPVSVSGLGEVKLIAAGAQFAMADGEPLPQVTAVSPDVGAESGGTTVTISGENLSEVTEVDFGSTPAASFTVNSATSITAVTQAGSGLVNVTASSAAGVSPIVPGDRYTFQAPPTVTKVSPKTLGAEGGTSVTITGTNFKDASAVDFGGVPAKSFVVESELTIVAVSPERAGGRVNVTVTNTDATSAPAKGNEVKIVPKLTAIEPASGPLAGGNTVTLRGVGLAGGPATELKFGKGVATNVECSSLTLCTAVVPAGREAGAVTVLFSIGKEKAAVTRPADEYTYE